MALDLQEKNAGGQFNEKEGDWDWEWDKGSIRFM